MVLAAALLCVVPSAAATADNGAPIVEASIYEQRLAYKRATSAIRNGRSREYRREAAKLQDYPLWPYLQYYEAYGARSAMRAERAKAVRAQLAETPLDERFFRQWLDAQARRGRWDIYLANYQPTDEAAGRCNYLRALYRSGERSAALRQVRELWVAAESQPKTCDPLFDAWIGAGHLDQDTVWARLELALAANERQLARYLLRFFKGDNAATGRLYYDVHVRPSLVRSLSRFPDTDGGRRALRHGLLRYADADAEDALGLWAKARRSRAYADADEDYIHEWLATAATEAGHMPADDPATFSAAAAERIALATVRHLEWPLAVRWIGALPADVRGEPTWRYWLGRALIETGAADAGREQLQTLAGLRTYYGFLAAEDIGMPPALNAYVSDHQAGDLDMLLDNPAVRRMVELYAVDDVVNARREWRYAASQLAPEQQRRLVELTVNIGWAEQAVVGARDADLLDMVHARFPMPHLDVYRRYAHQVNLPVHFLLAISRQESAFNPRAVSRAGARGLMQLMGPTAHAVADRIRVSRPGARDLFDPHVNVRLGAHHLAALLKRYDGNRALAAAAYNAGRSRVARWRKETSGMPTTVWIERIPFHETRNYVKGIIAFDHVYSRLTGAAAPVLAVHERVIP